MSKVTRYEWLVKSIAEHNSDRCLLWPFKVDEDGYGRMWFDGKQRAAHRVAFRIQHGRWPEPYGLHACDTPGCVNPKHIFEGTDADNHIDQVAKGRTTKGSMQACAKLTEELVIKARQEYRYGKLGFAALAKKYGVTKVAMRWAIEGTKHWKHVGIGVPAVRPPGNYPKETCKNGHPFTEGSFYLYGRRRQCKICTEIRWKERRKRLREAAK